MTFASVRWIAAALLLTTAYGCGGHPADVQIDGSSTVYPISEAVAEEALRTHPDIRLTVGKSGTGGGMKKFYAGQIDISNASRPMKPDEAEKCEAAGIDHVHFHIAYDGIAVIVHPSNDFCDSLSVAQLKEIFRIDSPIKTWSDLDPSWPNEEIHLVGPGTDSGTYDSFNEGILGHDTRIRADYPTSEEDNTIVNGVQQDKYGLGYLGYAYYFENADRLKAIAIDPGDGKPIAPTVETIREQTYTPLARPLYIYVNKASLKKEKVIRFVQFYLDHAAELAQDVGYVPVAESIAAENQQRLQSLLTPETSSSR